MGDVRFARKNSPEMFRASQRTTTIFCPLSSCLATVLARRPSRCPLPSMTCSKVSQMVLCGILCARRRLLAAASNATANPGDACSVHSEGTYDDRLECGHVVESGWLCWELVVFSRDEAVSSAERNGLWSSVRGFPTRSVFGPSAPEETTTFGNVQHE